MQQRPPSVALARGGLVLTSSKFHNIAGGLWLGTTDSSWIRSLQWPSPDTRAQSGCHWQQRLLNVCASH